MLDTKHGRVIGYGSEHPDAERIARALAVLDVIERHGATIGRLDVALSSMAIGESE